MGYTYKALGHACGPIVLACLDNNWPWPDHSKIVFYSPEMFSDSISDNVNLQNFLEGACLQTPRFSMLCMPVSMGMHFIILDLNPPTSENVPTPLGSVTVQLVIRGTK